jgi:hypothetical protein
MMLNKMNPMYKHMWWTKRGCEVEVLGTGHFPTTAMVKLLKEDHDFRSRHGRIDPSTKRSVKRLKIKSPN